MAYRFIKSEELPQACRRVFAEEIDWAVGQLTNSKKRVEAVHEARKSVKKIRALLSLLERPLGPLYKSADKNFRDVGRQLSPVRDNAVMLVVFDNLAAKHREIDASGRSEIRSNLERSRQEATNEKQVSRHVARLLHDACPIAEKWTLEGLKVEGLTTDFAAAYRRGKKRLKQAQDSGSAEAFHDFRKAVKQHWYHLKLIEEYWDRDMKQRASEVRDLETCLGDEHNLTVLRGRIAEDVETRHDRHQAQRFITVLDDHSKALCEQALDAGHRLYAAKASEFSGQLAQLWAEPKAPRTRPARAALRTNSAVA